MRIKLVAILSIIIGAIQLLYIIDSALFIEYISSVGAISWVSILIYSIILIIAGVLMISLNRLSLLFYWVYVYGLIIERLLKYFMYQEFVSILEIIIPIILTIPFFIFVHKKQVVNRVGLLTENTALSIVIVTIANVLIIGMPFIFLR